MQAPIDVLLSAHAQERMQERGWSKDEIIEAIAKNDRRVVVKLVYKVITVYHKNTHMITFCSMCENPCEKGTSICSVCTDACQNMCSVTDCTNACKKGKNKCKKCEKSEKQKKKADEKKRADEKKKKLDADKKKKQDAERKKREKAASKRLDELEKQADYRALLEYNAHENAIAIARKFKVLV